MKKTSHISFWVFIAMAVILVVFSVQNSGPIQVSILFKNVEISLAILLALTFLGGLVAGALYSYVKFNNKEKLKNGINQETSVSEIDDPATNEA